MFVLQTLVDGGFKQIWQQGSGPVGIVKEMRRRIEQGPRQAFMIIAMISIYLGLFNLLPMPGLDGGRLVFLGWEAVSRRRVNEKHRADDPHGRRAHAAGAHRRHQLQERHLRSPLPPLMRKRPGPAGRRARRPSSEVPGDTKEQILAVAEELFAQKGFAGVRTHEIAERAGVNKAMIYYWYQSKEQLLRAVLQKILFELIALSQEILARKLPRGRGARGVLSRLLLLRRAPSQLLAPDDDGSRLAKAATCAPCSRASSGRCSSAACASSTSPSSRGELKPVNARQLLITVYGMTIAYFADANQVALLYGVKDALDDKLLEERLGANLDFIFAAVGTKRPSKSR